MNELLIEFAAIIATYSVEQETGPGLKAIERCVFVFKDPSRLVTYESRKGSKFKFGYQWMTATHQPIYRWDNTPTFLISTHPQTTVIRAQKNYQNHFLRFH